MIGTGLIVFALQATAPGPVGPVIDIDTAVTPYQALGADDAGNWVSIHQGPYDPATEDVMNVRANFVSATGEPGPSIPIDSSTGTELWPAIAWSSARQLHLAVYLKPLITQGYDRVFGAILDPGGHVVGTPFRICDTPNVNAAVRMPTVASNGVDWFVAWQYAPPSVPGVTNWGDLRGRIVKAGPQFAGPAFAITASSEYREAWPAVEAGVDGRYLVAWNQVVSGNYGAWAICGRTVSADGSNQGELVRYDTQAASPSNNYQSFVRIAANRRNGGYMIAWRELAGLFARRLGADGVPIESELSSLDPATLPPAFRYSIGLAWNPQANQFHLTWGSLVDAASARIRGMRFNGGDGALLDPDFASAAIPYSLAPMLTSSSSVGSSRTAIQWVDGADAPTSVRMQRFELGPDVNPAVDPPPPGPGDATRSPAGCAHNAATSPVRIIVALAFFLSLWRTR